jgi:hypothetical protein
MELCTARQLSTGELREVWKFEKLEVFYGLS